MSRISTKIALVSIAAAFSSFVVLPAAAEGIERKYKFNNKRSGTTKAKKKSRNTRFDLFGIFGNSSRKKRAEQPELARRKLRNAKKFKRVERSKIYRYRSDRLVVLGDDRLGQPTNKVLPLFSAKGRDDHETTPVSAGGNKLDNSLAQTVFDLLKSSNTSTNVSRSQKKAILAFYKSRNYKPLWLDMDGALPNALQVLTFMSRAEEDGLMYRDYLPAGLRDYNEDLRSIESNIREMARLEISLTAMAVRYGQHASGGRIIPNRLSGYHDLKPPRVAASTILTNLAKSSEPEKYLASLHPSHKSYTSFKKMLAGLDRDAPQKQFAPIATNGTINPGGSGFRVGLIRQRLIGLGMLAGTVSDIDGEPVSNDYYDPALVDAVKAYQKSKGLRADGIMGRRTFSTFNRRKNLNKRKKLVLNMERMRWLPRHFGAKHIFVNQAAFELQVMQNNRQIWQTRVVVGKPRNQTSFFIDKMKTVVFNPYWGVPQSIITKEMLPRLQANPGYLDQRGYEVYNGRGRKVSSSSIDWYNYGGSRVPFSVRQPPGGRNALGRIKFLFPNKHAIYLHDTPSKSLFARSSRAFSHGCVRVKNPLKLAENVLGWKRGLIDKKIAAGRNSSVRLKKHIPVYLAYFTAWARPSGKVSFYGDVYGRDRRLDRALNSLAVAQK